MRVERNLILARALPARMHPHMMPYGLNGYTGSLPLFASTKAITG
jgi:hypothetical protein